jgi:hypothetical protein
MPSYIKATERRRSWPAAALFGLNDDRRKRLAVNLWR